MKKSILFITLLLLLSGHVYAQMTCKECLRRIYHEIYSKNLSSIKLNDQNRIEKCMKGNWITIQ